MDTSKVPKALMPVNALDMTKRQTQTRLAQIAALGRRSRAGIVAMFLMLAACVAAGYAIFAARGRTGEFKEWAETEVGISKTKAYDLLRVHRIWGTYKLSHLFCATALRNLCYAPASVRATAKALAEESNEPISLAKVDALIAEHSQRRRVVAAKIDTSNCTVVFHAKGETSADELQQMVAGFRQFMLTQGEDSGSQVSA